MIDLLGNAKTRQTENDGSDARAEVALRLSDERNWWGCFMNIGGACDDD